MKINSGVTTESIRRNKINILGGQPLPFFSARFKMKLQEEMSTVSEQRHEQKTREKQSNKNTKSKKKKKTNTILN